jgi:negative regulator of sigma-B (phosphoserine phosphatase)
VIEIGMAHSSLELQSGDRAVVRESETGHLLAAIDGLGHGGAAAEAAAAAAEVLEKALERPLEELIARCHEALARTRGAVLTLARVHDTTGRLEWVGVGNVEARLLRAGAVPGQPGGASPVLFGGVLGHAMPTVRPSEEQLGPGDVIVMATDGVRSDFVTSLSAAGSAQAIADRVLEQSARGGDDALVLVARWLREPEPS